MMPQVKTANGSWQQLQVPEGHMAVLAGYTLERATCGLIPAVTHRVVCTVHLCANLLAKHMSSFCQRSTLSLFAIE